uniref:Uncharacterized protein n=1 Tax=Glossina palpalis gambiensis TaxID=67801 RepID=A0A1B0C107_9MUSC
MKYWHQQHIDLDQLRQENITTYGKATPTKPYNPFDSLHQHLAAVSEIPKAGLLVDQWKKKAELYNTNVVLFPLGDDFRYSQNMEWEAQRVNCEAFFAHINGESNYFVEARFGTLEEYFDAVHQEQRERSKAEISSRMLIELIIIGAESELRTPARVQFFRCGSRFKGELSAAYLFLPNGPATPIHNNSSPVVLVTEGPLEFTHSLFQHHDGVTGTAKHYVVEDYAKRMLKAVNDCRFVMQQSVYRLLTKSTISVTVYFSKMNIDKNLCFYM